MTPRIAALVGIASGLGSAAVAGLAFWQFFMDDTGARMLDSAEGARSALERLAAAIEAEPELLGADSESATSLARAAEAVNRSVETAAQSRGLTIASPSRLGREFVVSQDGPIMMETPDGTLFGVSLHPWHFLPGYGNNLQINGQHYRGLKQGDVIRFEVAEARCQAVVMDGKPQREEIVVALTCG